MIRLPHSLAARLVLFATTAILLALLATGVAMDLALRRFIQGQVDSRLDTQILTVADALRVAPNGSLRLERSVDGPPFDRPPSSWVWEVLRSEGSISPQDAASPPADPVLRSRSLAEGAFRFDAGDPRWDAGPRPVTVDGSGPGEEPLRVRVQSRFVGQLRVTIAAGAPLRALAGPLHEILTPGRDVAAARGRPDRRRRLPGAARTAAPHTPACRTAPGPDRTRRPHRRPAAPRGPARRGRTEQPARPERLEPRASPPSRGQSRAWAEDATRDLGSRLRRTRGRSRATLRPSGGRYGPADPTSSRPRPGSRTRRRQPKPCRPRGDAGRPCDGVSASFMPTRAWPTKRGSTQGWPSLARCRISTRCWATSSTMPASGPGLVCSSPPRAGRRALNSGSRTMVLGLPSGKAEHVMRLGSRIDETAPGYGFGLPITRELVELYGGTLTLGRSRLGGLLATLDLPGAAMTGPFGSVPADQGRLAVTHPQVWTCVVAGSSTLGVILRPFGWPEAIWAVSGAALLVLLGTPVWGRRTCRGRQGHGRLPCSSSA